jgi:hypothetical protein
MKTLLSGGCSFIYGSELSDSPAVYSHNSHSNKTWPALYAKSRNLNYKTCAVCGASNRGIVRYIINEVEKNFPDYVVIQWTFLHRYEIRLNRHDLDENDSFYYALYHYQSTDFVNKENHLNDAIKNLHPLLKNFATFWFRHVDDDISQLYYYYQSKIELANYLRYKNIPFVFTDSQTPHSHFLEHTSDKTLHTLYKLNTEIPQFLFENRGFYDWSKLKKFNFGISHPLDDAHESAFNFISQDLDSFLNIK